MRDDVRQMGMALMDSLRPKSGETFTLKSSRYVENGIVYSMVVTPEGYAVHDGLGCEDEHFRGPLLCRHSLTRTPTEEEMTQALTKYEDRMPVRIDFTDEQLKTITDVICVDSQGNRAPPAFVQLYLAACRHTGLDPFLRQIYALNLKGKWTMYVGIDGYRVISQRTGLDDGMDGPQWSNDGENWYDYPSDDAARYCRVGIWRKGVSRAYTAVVSMATKINPTSQSWKDDPNGMLAKCAEILGRRRAFPADMAVLNDVALDLEDPDGVPMTRAEVPEGAYRELDAPTPPPAPEHGATQEEGRAQPAATVPASGVPPESPPALTPPQLLNRIEHDLGLPAKQAAIAVMTRLFDTASPTKLDDDQRAEYATILAFRLADKGHEHTQGYTPRMVPVCTLCGDEVAEEAQEPATSPEQAALV